MVTDNVVSEEFQTFCRVNGIKHITSAPYHPSTNGLAERAIQSFKQGLKKLKKWAAAVEVIEHICMYILMKEEMLCLGSFDFCQ